MYIDTPYENDIQISDVGCRLYWKSALARKPLKSTKTSIHIPKQQQYNHSSWHTNRSVNDNLIIKSNKFLIIYQLTFWSFTYWHAVFSHWHIVFITCGWKAPKIDWKIKPYFCSEWKQIAIATLRERNLPTQLCTIHYLIIEIRSTMSIEKIRTRQEDGLIQSIHTNNPHGGQVHEMPFVKER